METNKFDKELKQHLDGRKIAPSDSSWEKLAQQLDHKPEKSKKSFWWLGAVAVFMAGILIGALVFNPVSREGNIPQIVNDPMEKEMHDKPASKSKKWSRPEKAVAPVSAVAASDKKPQEKVQKGIEKQLDRRAQTEKGLGETSGEVAQFPEKSIEALVANELPETVTDEEVESLLRLARLQIQTGGMSQQTTNKVDAQALLESAEMEKPSRERIFRIVRHKLVELVSSNQAFDR